MTPHTKFQGATSTWVVWANSQFDEWKFVFFSFIHHANRSHFRTHPNAHYVIKRRTRQGSAFWGYKDDIWNLIPFTSKKRKNWDFKLAVNVKILVIIGLYLCL